MTLVVVSSYTFMSRIDQTALTSISSFWTVSLMLRLLNSWMSRFCLRNWMPSSSRRRRNSLESTPSFLYRILCVLDIVDVDRSQHLVGKQTIEIQWTCTLTVIPKGITFKVKCGRFHLACATGQWPPNGAHRTYG